MIILLDELNEELKKYNLKLSYHSNFVTSWLQIDVIENFQSGLLEMSKSTTEREVEIK